DAQANHHEWNLRRLCQLSHEICGYEEDRPKIQVALDAYDGHLKKFQPNQLRNQNWLILKSASEPENGRNGTPGFVGVARHERQFGLVLIDLGEVFKPGQMRKWSLHAEREIDRVTAAGQFERFICFGQSGRVHFD